MHDTGIQCTTQGSGFRRASAEPAHALVAGGGVQEGGRRCACWPVAVAEDEARLLHQLVIGPPVAVAEDGVVVLTNIIDTKVALISVLGQVTQ